MSGVTVLLSQKVVSWSIPLWSYRSQEGLNSQPSHSTRVRTETAEGALQGIGPNEEQCAHGSQGHRAPRQLVDATPIQQAQEWDKPEPILRSQNVRFQHLQELLMPKKWSCHWHPMTSEKWPSTPRHTMVRLPKSAPLEAVVYCSPTACNIKARKSQTSIVRPNNFGLKTARKLSPVFPGIGHHFQEAVEGHGVDLFPPSCCKLCSTG